MSKSQSLIEKRSALIADAEAITAQADAEERDLTTEEESRIAELLDEARTLDPKISNLAELEQRAAQAAELRAKHNVDVAPARVVREARTYTAAGDNSFLRDAFNAQFNNDYSAQERLTRHAREEQVERRSTSTSFTGLVVPQYLTDLAAPLARAGRPLADAARRNPLPPSGLTLNISRITTGSTVATQSESGAVSNTDIDDTLLTVNVVTRAGMQNVSRQAIERGTSIDSVVMADLVSSYHTTLDAAVCAEVLSTAGQSVTYTDASPTVAELYPKVLDAVQKIQTNFFAGPNVIVMHPRRLAWILAATDTAGRPLAVPTVSGPQNAISSGDGSIAYGNSGYQIAGFPVITDANILTNQGAGTNEDTIYVGATQELHLWEEGDGSPMMLRFEQPRASNLDIQIVVYGYSAMTAGRYPNAWAKIGGTGLVTPTF